MIDQIDALSFVKNKDLTPNHSWGSTDWQEVEEGLLYFSEKIGKARRNYRRFVEEGIKQGRRPDLQGSGFGRNTDEEKLDARMLGSGGFIEKVLRDANEIEGRRKRRIPLAELVQRVSENLQVDERDLLSGDRRSQVSKARPASRGSAEADGLGR
jgi:hypothetical protein